MKHCDDVQEVSIIPRGSAGGYTMSRPETDDLMMSIGKANDTIAMSMGGRIAEEIIFKDITSGASSDIQHATKLAHAMVYEWGMSKKVGFLALSSNSQVFIGRDYQTKNDFSEKLAAIADEEIMSILNNNYKRAKQILTDKIEILHEMAKLLMERETIYKEEVDMVMAGKKTEEIVALMEKKEKAQKEKEEKIRAEKVKLDKLKAYEAKLVEGEKLVKAGVISAAELESVKKEYEAYKKSLDESLTVTKTEDTKEEKEPKVEKKTNEVKKTDKVEKETESKKDEKEEVVEIKEENKDDKKNSGKKED